MSLADSDFEDSGLVDAGLDQSFDAPVEGAETPAPAPAAPNYRKQGFSIYTVMLILSFVFLLTAMILLFMEVDRLG